MSTSAVNGSNEAGTPLVPDTGRLRILQVSGSAAGGGPRPPGRLRPDPGV